MTSCGLERSFRPSMGLSGCDQRLQQQLTPAPRVREACGTTRRSTCIPFPEHISALAL